MVEAAKPVKGYEPVTLGTAIAPTIATASVGKVEVFGQPRMSQGHPCTLWDKEDVNHFQAMLKTSKELQDQFAKLKAAMDKRMAKPLGVPVAEEGCQRRVDVSGRYRGIQGQTVLSPEPRERGRDFRPEARSMP